MKPSETESVQVTTARNGPYLVTGPVVVHDHDDTPISAPTGPMIALCRCGHSANKPFCDGAHARNGFDGTTSANNRAAQ